MNHVLIVDDDQTLCQLLTEFLAIEQFEASSVHDGAQALPQIQQHSYDAVVLDIMLPNISGIELLQQIRKTSDIPILMLTARGEDMDRILGLELGADDYLPKPCNPRELVARLKAILRRTKSHLNISSNASFNIDLPELGCFSVEHQARRVLLAGQEIKLTATEFDLLESLINQPDTTLSKQELSIQVLGKPLSSYDRSLDMHISNLRKKLPPPIADAIDTIRGIGYRYTPSEIR
ncbi:MAG: DNA-binding response regulator [Oceanospirillum sp.]|nr:DNA-binding response regulator [Oceanospirillum sp.]